MFSTQSLYLWSNIKSGTLNKFYISSPLIESLIFEEQKGEFYILLMQSPPFLSDSLKLLVTPHVLHRQILTNFGYWGGKLVDTKGSPGVDGCPPGVTGSPTGVIDSTPEVPAPEVGDLSFV